MRYIHHIWLTVYSKPEDDELVIRETLLKLLSFNIEKEKLKLEVTNLAREKSAFRDRNIKVFQIHLEKNRHINNFIHNINETLTQEQIELLIRQSESRLDSENHFFIRFDKEKLIKDKKYFITDRGNCFHIRMSIAAFPATRENALNAIKKIFNNI